MLKPAHQDKTTFATQEQTTAAEPRHQEQTTLHKLTNPVPNSLVGGLTTTTEQRTIAKLNISTEDVLGCLKRNIHPLWMTAEEVWLNFTYTGNTSGSPRLSKPSKCGIQVYKSRPGVMSMLIFNTSCFKDNQLEVVSGLQESSRYDCDPTAWVAPGIELVSSFASLIIYIRDIDVPFHLHAQLKVVPREWRNILEVRWVTRYLGRKLFGYFLNPVSAQNGILALGKTHIFFFLQVSGPKSTAKPLRACLLLIPRRLSWLNFAPCRTSAGWIATGLWIQDHTFW